MTTQDVSVLIKGFSRSTLFVKKYSHMLLRTSRCVQMRKVFGDKNLHLNLDGGIWRGLDGRATMELDSIELKTQADSFFIFQNFAILVMAYHRSSL